MTDKADVFITGEKNRIVGIQSVLGVFELPLFSGTSFTFNANFENADLFPASTRIDTLDTLCNAVLEQHPSRVTLVERKGIGNTQDVPEIERVFDLFHE